MTKLIIAHNHDRTKHQGKGLTINEIRSNSYWIPEMSRAVATYVRQCVTCRGLMRSPEGQKMSDLPVERVESSPPFKYCGMDCFCPFFTTDGRKQHKRYGLLFTCFCSRAIHIEICLQMLSSTACDVSLQFAVQSVKFSATKALTLLVQRMNLRQLCKSSTHNDSIHFCHRSSVTSS